MPRPAIAISNDDQLSIRRRARGRAETTLGGWSADLLVANFDASEDSPVTVGSDDESLPHAPTAQGQALEPGDWATVRRIYAEGIATGNATFETEVPERRELDRTWLPEHRWVAESTARSPAGPR